MDKKDITRISAVVLVVIFAAVAGYLTLFKKSELLQIACTQEARQCPDGSYVGRIGPDCEFAECPASPIPSQKPGGEQIFLEEGERESSFLLEKIYPHSVTGLNFGEYPVATDRGYPATLRIGEIVSNGCTITLTLVGINGNTAVFIKKTNFNRPCPICLAKDTLIDTPSGAIQIQKLHKGARIWTINGLGERVPASILKTIETPVPPTHQIIHLVLNDRRELFVSPGHPTSDGRAIGNLSPGDLYDNASVISSRLVPYDERATYDILPSGETGFYWANGILLDSTLH